MFFKIHIKKFILVAALGCFFSCSHEPVSYVDPFIGTDFHGHTYPGATTPYGAVQLSPDTREGNWDACSGYHYSDSTIFGFSHTHLSGTGCCDFGDILFRPTNLPAESLQKQVLNYKNQTIQNSHNVQNDKIAVQDFMIPIAFSHRNEFAEPGYYKVLLDESIESESKVGGESKENESILAELTATTHVGVHKYTFKNSSTNSKKKNSLSNSSNSSSSNIIVDLNHLLTSENLKEAYLKQSGENEIAGMRLTDGWVDNQQIYFIAQFSENIQNFTPLVTDKKGDVRVANLNFGQNKEIIAKVGVSIVSIENAKENLEKECPHFNFDLVKEEAKAIWNKKLSKIKIKSSSKDVLTNFYTCLYHTMVVPNQINDVNGEYRMPNNEIGNVEKGRNEYSTLSVWDTYRAWGPMMTLLDKKLISDIIHSSLNFYEIHGELPIWPLSCGETRCMIGYHTVSFILNAYMQGIQDFDTKKAIEAMVASAKKNKKGADFYGKYGYIPSDIKAESVSCLLEYSYDDWCIARFAELTGNKEVAEEFYNRCLNYTNVFDGNSGFFRGKRLDGNWETNFDENIPSREYTEASAWQYRFAAMHDINGMIQEFGGKEEFIKALDNIFVANSKAIGEYMVDITGLIGQYAHGNEPSHHIPFLYNYVGEPWKTQELCREILSTMYTPKPDGLCGNEDCGQMSAWYILTSLGIYEVIPGSNEFVLTSPLIESADIELPNGKHLIIKANNPLKHKYIQSVSFNGKALNKAYITYDEIMQGGELVFKLGKAPNKEWGQEVPESFTKGNRVSIPYVNEDLFLFDDSIDVEIQCRTEGAKIYYTLDGSTPTNNSIHSDNSTLSSTSKLYTKPIRIKNNAFIKAIGYKEGFAPSRVMQVKAEKAVLNRSIKRHNLHQGVRVKYYELDFTHSCYEMKNAKPLSEYSAKYPSIDLAKRNDDFGFMFYGYINVPETGKYAFQTRSDNGSILFIGGKRPNISKSNKVVDNDGDHSTSTATGFIKLEKGLHAYSILFYENWGDEHLSWSWKLPSSDKFVRVPENVLYY